MLKTTKQKGKENIRKSRKRGAREQGITLVALVITVIIIIILATVAINFAFGNNGLITRAEQAKDFYSNDTRYTEDSTTNVEGYLDSIISEISGSEEGGGSQNPPSVDVPGGSEALEKGAILFTNLNWSNEKASISISTNTSYTIQYQVVADEGESNDSNWKTLPEGGVIENLNHRDIVYARLVQGTNYGEEASATVKDENAPQAATIQLSSTNVTTGINVTAAVTHLDNESGPNISQCKYIWNTSSAKLGTDASLYTGGTFSSNGQQIIKTMSAVGTWYLHVLTVDNAENGTETVSSGVTVRQLVTSISVSPSSVTLEKGQTRQLTATVNPSNANTKTVTWSSNNTTVASVNSSTGLVTAKKEGSATITATATDGSGVKGSCTVTVKSAELPESTSYVGYYADVDGNGSVDGVIYADLAIGGSGQWGGKDGAYTIPKGSNFKKYGISKTNHNDDFETADVIKVTNSSGNERFYVMALDDFDTGLHYWYYDAYGNMNDYASCTSMAFGSGEQNTRNMITKWNASEYGEQNAGDYTDLWGLDAIQSGTWNGSTGWYVPSAGEWAAFAGNLGIYTYNYKDKGLSDDYVSSSQASHTYIWNPQFFTGYVMTKHVRGKIPVRLGTTF